MIIDAQLLFDDAAEHLTTGASTNVLDLQEARNLGVGEDLYAVVVVDTAFTDVGSDSTMTVTLETDDNEAFSSAVTAQTIGTFSALAAAGSRLIAKLTPNAINEQFVRLKYTPANGDLTTGSFTAFIAKDIDAFTAYPSGFSVA